MGQQSRVTLKTYFNTGDTPTEAQFVDLIDSHLHTADIGVGVQAYSAVLAATTASFLTADETKLDGIEAAADVTDATNVAAAGAVMTTGTQTVAGVKTFSSSPIVPAPTTDLQAATKKYVDDAVTAGGGYTNEMAQDAVGAMVDVAGNQIIFAYTDATPLLSATIKAESVTATELDAATNASLTLADSALQPGDADPTTAATVGAVNAAATSKATPVDADSFPIVDSEAASVIKRLTFTNLKAFLVTYFNTLYQAVLVSGTNIKTINSTSILGSGNIAVSASPAGSTGDIQFNASGALAANSLLDWDNTNARLGVGVAAPVYKFDFVQDNIAGVTSIANTEGRTAFFGQNPSAGNRSGLIVGTNSAGLGFIQGRFNTGAYLMVLQPYGGEVVIGSTTGFFPAERLGVNGGARVRGTGTTNANNALIAENSAGTVLVYVKNNGETGFGSTSNHASALVQIDSSTKGFLPPRMTTTERNAISSPAAGLIIYNTTTNKLNVYTTAWEAITSA